MKPPLSILARGVFLLFIISICLASYLLLWLGKANLVSSLVIYFSLFCCTYYVLQRLIAESFSVNARLLFGGICISVLILEFGLRFSTEDYKSGMEKNGSFWYECPYSNYRMDNLVKYLVNHDARVYAFPKDYTHIQDCREFRYSHKFNSLGLRDEEPTKEEASESFTVVGFGDSFTEGVGAPQDSTWVALLERQLSSENCTSISTVNAGKSGSDIFFESYKFQHLIVPNYKVHVAVFAINDTDIDDIMIRGGSDRFVSNNWVQYRKGPWWSYIYSFS